MKKTIYYWSPCIDKVGTVKSTMNSALAVSKFSREYDVKVINVFGEWNDCKEIFFKNNVEKIDLNFNYYNLIPRKSGNYTIKSVEFPFFNTDINW